MRLSSPKGVPCVAASVGMGLYAIPRIAEWLGVEPRVGSLLAIGTSICGVTAISALSPAIGAKEEETGVAVSNVVVFGAMGMLLYPHLAHALFATSPAAAGMFLGLAVHDTSQVVGAGQTYVDAYGQPAVLAAACVTKLTRNVGLAAALPYLAASGSAALTKQWYEHIPGFVVLFVGASLARSAGDSVWGNLAMWTDSIYMIGTVAPKYLLGVAMGAVGLGISPRALTRHGWRPFAVGGLGALLVASTGLASAFVVTSVM